MGHTTYQYRIEVINVQDDDGTKLLAGINKFGAQGFRLFKIGETGDFSGPNGIYKGCEVWFESESG